MSRVVALAAILMTAVLAGCAGDPGDPSTQEEPVPESIENVEVTATTGAIRGVVVNDAITPLDGVLITLTDGTNTSSDVDGGFVFNGLEPGDYFLQATKNGFVAQQTSATVVAGDEEPPITKIIMPIKASGKPYTVMQTWEGYMQCAFMVADGFFGMNTCGLIDDRFIHYYSMDRIPDFAQAEGVWDSTQALGQDLSLSYYDGGTWHFKEVHGTSPLVVSANATEIVEWWEDENLTELPMRMFPGSGPAAVVYNQQFTVYMTFFYNFLPRDGWQFIVDGPCDTPDQCS